MIVQNTHLVTENNSLIENLGILSIPGIIIWWDANSFSRPNGTRIDNLIDRAGSGFNLQQPLSTRQPRIKTNALAGNNTIEFDIPGATSTLLASRAGLSSIINNRIIEIFQVSQVKNTPSNFLYWHFRAVNNPLIRANQTTANRLLLGATNATGGTTTINVPVNLNNNQFYIFYSKFDFSFGGVEMTAEVIDNGTATGTQSGDFTFDRHTFRVGAGNNAVAMEQGEIILFSNTEALTSANKLSVINYLKDKYNI
jgi:hypothetical protein